MESIGLYLRDVELHSEALRLYRDANGDAERDQAIDLYLAAHKDIDELADVWGMKFLPIDLLSQSSAGHPQWDGPYCGIFYTTHAQPENPFIGIAFKGTSPINRKEWAVDFNYQLVTAGKYFNDGTPDIQVSEGVYTSLFGKLDGQDNTTYELILSRVRERASQVPNPKGGPIPVHVTGHSLGGSYASMCYTQFLIDVAPLSPSAGEAVMGDAYTFGSPRVGNKAWAAATSQLVGVHSGQSWRIVNNRDLVPRVPPTSLKPKELAFCQVDQGVHIWPQQSPAYVPSEQGQPSPKPYPITSILYPVPTLLGMLDHRECMQMRSKVLCDAQLISYLQKSPTGIMIPCSTPWTRRVGRTRTS